MIDIAAALSTLVSGATSGVVGSSIGAIVGYFTEKEKNRTSIELAKIGIENKNIDQNIAEVDRHASAIHDEMQDRLFKSEYMQHLLDGSGKYSALFVSLTCMAFAVIDVIKASVRPTVTYLSISYLGYLVYMFNGDITGYLQAKPEVIVMSVIYLVTTIVTWWFSDRRIAKNVNRILGLK
jgi:Flp pilus assembly protein TadB